MEASSIPGLSYYRWYRQGHKEAAWIRLAGSSVWVMSSLGTVSHTFYHMNGMPEDGVFEVPLDSVPIWVRKGGLDYRSGPQI